jgi:hypothetical protein
MSSDRKMTQFRLPAETRKQIAELKKELLCNATEVVVLAVQELTDVKRRVPGEPRVLELHLDGTTREKLARDLTIDAGSQSIRLIRNGDPVLKPGHKTL